MARTDLRHRDNAPGDWFVDTRCIDCGTCREVAPELFDDIGGCSVVARQPDEGEVTDAWLAAQACPTSSIGTLSRQPRPGRLYPRRIEPDLSEGPGVVVGSVVVGSAAGGSVVAGSVVFDCGYCSEDSFGASAWFVQRPDGNLLIDSPRFTEALVRPIAEAGGIAHVLLTHRDDVADAARWAERFSARVWIHADDRRAAPLASDVIDGEDDAEIEAGVISVWTPGHTKGSVMYLVDGRYLFTGDSLAWSHERSDLMAFRDACWWSWSAQADSLERLADRHRFAWVLPGHGARTQGDPEVLHERLVRLVDRMRATPASRF
jgi:glyoxylase-like metal-dependent hydrolase (beta-lactamase superfamily II)/ferredoxin